MIFEMILNTAVAILVAVLVLALVISLDDAINQRDNPAKIDKNMEIEDWLNNDVTTTQRRQNTDV